MYKVGDEVLVKGEIVSVDEEVPYPVEVRVCACCPTLCFTEEELKLATKTYEQGLADAWELAKKIATETKDGGIPCDDMCVMFGTDIIPTIFTNFTFEDCRDKIEAYEKEKEIKVGSIVKSRAGGFGVVSRIEHEKYYVMWRDGSCASYTIERLINTGKTTDSLKSLLRQIGE